MKKKYFKLPTLLIILFLMCVKANSGNYTVNFTGSGAATTVESVIVQNLTQGTTVTVPAGNVLVLSDQPNAMDQVTSNDEAISLYPIGLEGKYVLSFLSKNPGVTQINAYGMDGRKITGITTDLQSGINSFQLLLPKGLYAIQVTGNGYAYSTKLVNQTGSAGKTGITYSGTDNAAVVSTKQKSKSSFAAIQMNYSAGDRLLYKGISGNFCTIVTDLPVESKTINFDFLECKDASGNFYSVVKIGSQTWMAENLKTTKYRNGDDIINFSNNSDWGLYSISAWCNYNNDATNGTNLGKLYNWYSVSESRNITPVGWHVASDADWTLLTTSLGGVSISGDKLKETGLNHWGTPNATSTNEVGFTALPGGYRMPSGQFDNLGNKSNWWSLTENGVNYAWYRSIDKGSASITRDYYNKNTGFSIRCVKDATLPVLTTVIPTSISYTSANGGGNITSNGGASVTACGVCWGTTANPTILNNKSIDSIGSNTFRSSITGLNINTTYYVRAYATNITGTAYGDQVVFKSLPYDSVIVTDADGNLYHSITIGTQKWMVENLKTTKYNDGTSIPLIDDSYQWIYLTTPGYCWANNDISNKDIFGALYNFNSVKTGKLAPIGWHVPSDSDWTTLINYLGGLSVAGSKLKESGTTHWYYPNDDATNVTGFTGLPGGYRSSATGNYINIGNWGCWWSSTSTNGNVRRTIVANYNSLLNYLEDNGIYGFSVRCIKD